MEKSVEFRALWEWLVEDGFKFKTVEPHFALVSKAGRWCVIGVSASGAWVRYGVRSEIYGMDGVTVLPNHSAGELCFALEDPECFPKVARAIRGHVEVKA
jgi:hypothetical protein